MLATLLCASLSLEKVRAVDAALPTPGEAFAAPAVTLDQKVEERVDRLLSQLTLEQKIDLLGGTNSMYTKAILAIGLPSLQTSDGPLGVKDDRVSAPDDVEPATAFPGGVALAATWDPRLAESMGEQIGRDARARGIHFMLGPGVNMYMAPMCARNFEYFGEDPFLASRLAVGYIDGIQSQGVSATVKHFAANNSEYNRHGSDAIIDERTLHEIYLPAFEAAVKEAHVGSIMDSYNVVNGQHPAENGPLNIDIAKKLWGFDGVMMSDWGATSRGVDAANSGLDLEMPSGLYMNRQSLLPAITNGTVTVATIDDKVRRLLRTVVRFGWLDRDQTDLSIPRLNPEADAVALAGAREAIVLLKDQDKVLPLDARKVRSIAVIGPDAYPAVVAGGGSGQTYPFLATSFLEGIKAAAGDGARVFYDRGVPTWRKLTAATVFHVQEKSEDRGMKTEVFTNPKLEGEPAYRGVDADFNSYDICSMAGLTRTEAEKLFHEQHGSSIRWTGYYTAPATGPMDMFVYNLDKFGGYRLWIDGTLAFDHWDIRKALMDRTCIPLTSGTHKVVIEQWEPQWFRLPLRALRIGIIPQSEVVNPNAVALAAKADAVVLAVGYDSSSEEEGGDRAFGLPLGQEELIQQVSAANPKTIVVVTSGGAVDTRSWLDRVPVLLQAGYPGQAGGTALAEILYGKVNPSGKLPYSYDRSWEENPSHDCYYPEPGSVRVKYNGLVGYRG
ncbi:MAG TPA: glycoside hydrolase family 3 C-terminal domain-containing protein, partial [Verrucomicrobiae bacterium]